jgi:hypothetical protein
MEEHFVLVVRNDIAKTYIPSYLACFIIKYHELHMFHLHSIEKTQETIGLINRIKVCNHRI